MQLSDPLLLTYLRGRNEQLYAKAKETRERVAIILRAVPATFSHYTDHSISHSDEILRQLSNILFSDDTEQPIVGLSAAEAYLLCIGAYLHDVGMIVTEKEKISLLSTRAWSDFIASAKLSGLWADLEQQVADSSQSAATQRYVADLQTRYLIAEFFRQHHSDRSAMVVLSQEQQLAGFAFDEPAVKQTLADICAGHGLERNQLDDHVTFPFRRDLLGERVNVRLLVILLRIGDLLDLRYSRACPLMMSAVSPVPFHSLAHWGQYSSIQHLLVAPDRVEMRARCRNHEEHRVLRDWFDWLASETSEAGRLLAGSTRHSQWTAPLVTLDGPNPTVEIAPAENANYTPVSWRFELDPSAVFERLIRDAYKSPLSFIGELLQNSIDASRVRLSEELRGTPVGIPLHTNMAPLRAREQYPIIVTIERAVDQAAFPAESSGLLVSIRDNGIGMDEEIIKKYLLQVGRSYYTSPDFAASYSFTPSSRFGIGFLSVFAVSKDVTVETRRAGAPYGIRLGLTGPRSYLLFEKSQTNIVGTEIRVSVGSQFTMQQIMAYVMDRAKMVEFPISIIGPDSEVLAGPFVGSDTPDAEIPETPLPDGLCVRMRAHKLKGPEAFGSLYHQVLVMPDGSELWAQSLFSHIEAAYPFAPIPALPKPVLCINGLTTGHSMDQPQPYPVPVVDLRGPKAAEMPVLSRSELRSQGEVPWQRQWIEQVERHLSSASLPPEKMWVYRLGVIMGFSRVLGEWAYGVTDTVRLFRDGVPHTVSIRELVGMGDVHVVSHIEDRRDRTSLADLIIGGDSRDHLTARDLVGIKLGDYRSWLRHHSLNGVPLLALPDLRLFSGFGFRPRPKKVARKGDWQIVVVVNESNRPARRDWMLVHDAPSLVEVEGYEEWTFCVPENVSRQYGRVGLVAGHPLAKAWERAIEGDGSVPGLSDNALWRIFDELRTVHHGVGQERLLEMLEQSVTLMRGAGVELPEFRFEWRKNYVNATPVDVP
ncbi:ATP-binding protein [Micromonospora aurantiaca]|uniref:HD domain-containing protein n=1 Tax=Micromonospora aurantiaca (nom. illeg.) TaxID=47850 RepID=UPI001E5AF7AE|nr:ATP-binding protein [Micromonospora aurantiaca]UFN94257.1 ATP-binding protein [Micromonospora aurantiaca]